MNKGRNARVGTSWVLNISALRFEVLLICPFLFSSELLIRVPANSISDLNRKFQRLRP